MPARRSIRFTTLIAAALISTGLAFIPNRAPAQGAADRAESLAGITENHWGGLFVQNLDPVQSAAIDAEFRFGDEEDFPLRRTVAPAGAAYFEGAPTEPGLPNGVYTVVARADRPIRAVARADWREGGAAMHGDALPATDIILAPVVKGWSGVSSVIAIQNTDEQQTATVTLTLSYQSTEMRHTLQIPAAQSAIIETNKDSAFALVPSGTIGSIRLHATVPVAALLLEDGEIGVAAIEGIPVDAAAARLSVPAFGYRLAPGPDTTSGGGVFDSLLFLVNPGATATEVDVVFRGRTRPCEGQTLAMRRFVVGAGQWFGIGPGGGWIVPSGLPAGCLASASIQTDGGTVVASVLDSFATAQFGGRLGPSLIHGYGALPVAAGDTTVYLPAVRRRYSQHLLSTAVHVVNTAGAPAHATLTLRGPDGVALAACAGCRVAIEAGAGFTWWPQQIAGLADGWIGSAVVTSDLPVVAIAVDQSATGTWDSASYAGLSGRDDRPDRQQAFVPAFFRGLYQLSSFVPPPGAFATPAPPTPTPSPSLTPAPRVTQTAGPTQTPGSTRTPGPTASTPGPGTTLWLPIALKEIIREDWVRP